MCFTAIADALPIGVATGFRVWKLMLPSAFEYIATKSKLMLVS